MTKKGSLTHNGCYLIKGPQRRADYESTIKQKKNISKRFFYGTKKLLTTKERSSSTNSVLPADITESMRSDYSEGSDGLLNRKLENEEDLRFITETSSSNRLNKSGSLPTSPAKIYIVIKP